MQMQPCHPFCRKIRLPVWQECQCICPGVLAISTGHRYSFQSLFRRQICSCAEGFGQVCEIFGSSSLQRSSHARTIHGIFSRERTVLLQRHSDRLAGNHVATDGDITRLGARITLGGGDDFLQFGRSKDQLVHVLAGTPEVVKAFIGIPTIRQIRDGVGHRQLQFDRQIVEVARHLVYVTDRIGNWGRKALSLLALQPALELGFLVDVFVEAPIPPIEIRESLVGSSNGFKLSCPTSEGQ